MSLSEKLWNAEADHVIDERDELEEEVKHLCHQREELLTALKWIVVESSLPGPCNQILDAIHVYANAIIASAMGDKEK